MTSFLLRSEAHSGIVGAPRASRGLISLVEVNCKSHRRLDGGPARHPPLRDSASKLIHVHPGDPSFSATFSPYFGGIRSHLPGERDELGVRVKQLAEAQIASGFRSPNAETLTAYRSALPGSQGKTCCPRHSDRQLTRANDGWSTSRRGRPLEPRCPWHVFTIVSEPSWDVCRDKSTIPKTTRK
jgi:hypothetical protein